MIPLAACFKAILEKYDGSSHGVKMAIAGYLKSVLSNNDPDQAAVTERIGNMIRGSTDMRIIVRDMVLSDLSAAEEYDPDEYSEDELMADEDVYYSGDEETDEYTEADPDVYEDGEYRYFLPNSANGEQCFLHS